MNTSKCIYLINTYIVLLKHLFTSVNNFLLICVIFKRKQIRHLISKFETKYLIIIL